MATRASRRRLPENSEFFDPPAAINTRKRNVKHKENLVEETSLGELKFPSRSSLSVFNVPQSEKVKRKKNILKEQNTSLQLNLEDVSIQGSDIAKVRKGRSKVKEVKIGDNIANYDSASSNQDETHTKKKRGKKPKKVSITPENDQDDVTCNLGGTAKRAIFSDDESSTESLKSNRKQPKKASNKRKSNVSESLKEDGAISKAEQSEIPKKKKNLRRRNYVSLIGSDSVDSNESNIGQGAENLDGKLNKHQTSYPEKNENMKKPVQVESENIQVIVNDSLDSFHSAAGSPLKDKHLLDHPTSVNSSQVSQSITDGSLEKTSHRKSERNSLNIFDTTPTILIQTDSDSSLKINSDLESTLCKRTTYSKSPTMPVVMLTSLETQGSEKVELKREGTFTMESDEVEQPVTPEIVKKSLSAPGSTPFHPNGARVTRNKSDLNLTHSIEKNNSLRRSISDDAVNKRHTKVMFCSPIFQKSAEKKRKSKIIKSSIKGSNKSFVYEENDSRCLSHKRSFTHNDVEQIEKRKKLTSEQLNDSVNRLSKPKKHSLSAQKATLRVSDAVTPSTSSNKKIVRSKLPDFASLHKRQFEKMESLGECQERKARRALQLLGPGLPEKRRSPRGHPASSIPKLQPKVKREETKTTLNVPSVKEIKPQSKNKTLRRNDPLTKSKHKVLNAKEKPSQLNGKLKPNAALISQLKQSLSTTNNISQTKNISLPKQDITQDKGAKSFNRFGFKMDFKSNPFSVETKPKQVQNNEKESPNKSLVLNGTNKEKAVRSVMREKSNLEKIKSDSRSMIKGVRMNRRFELQMKMRNTNG